ncbi:hypothetical protein N7499_005501 [Penicillium canescens]|nr:hypothetical protein N7522_009780 [Penicillium canescens]KAJ6080627.1 hypothetical protein N7499_005501 [Penicillium canescens]KAJ6177582.1 hypothetical protein N7485_004496 [Penicillium canescens]
MAFKNLMLFIYLRIKSFPALREKRLLLKNKALLRYHHNASADDEAEYWVPLSTRDSIKILVMPAFPTWTTEQMEEYQTFYEELDLDAAESGAEYVPMTWTATSTSRSMTTSA